MYFNYELVPVVRKRLENVSTFSSRDSLLLCPVKYMHVPGFVHTEICVHANTSTDTIKVDKSLVQTLYFEASAVSLVGMIAAMIPHFHVEFLLCYTDQSKTKTTIREFNLSCSLSLICFFFTQQSLFLFGLLFLSRLSHQSSKHIVIYKI